MKKEKKKKKRKRRAPRGGGGWGEASLVLDNQDKPIPWKAQRDLRCVCFSRKLFLKII